MPVPAALEALHTFQSTLNEARDRVPGSKQLPTPCSPTPSSMPAISLYGRRWHFSTDVIPVPAFIGACYCLAWALVMLLGAAISGQWPEHCQSHEGVQYVVLFASMFSSFVLLVVVQALLIWQGLQGEGRAAAWCRVGGRRSCLLRCGFGAQPCPRTHAGAPFELSKRRHVPTLLYAGTAPMVLQLTMAGAVRRSAPTPQRTA